jgi:3-dehydroquinate dehydratase
MQGSMMCGISETLGGRIVVSMKTWHETSIGRLHDFLIAVRAGFFELHLSNFILEAPSRNSLQEFKHYFNTCGSMALAISDVFAIPSSSFTANRPASA